MPHSTMPAESSADVIVNAAGYTTVDRAESEQEIARHINTDAVEVLSKEARQLGAWLVYYSSDYMFNGAKGGPYSEPDLAHLLNVHGRTKLEGEEAIRMSGYRHVIFRTSWLLSARGVNFTKTIV
jgi:dTDP-4-dehydrorhamnose reductase